MRRACFLARLGTALMGCLLP
jgi:serine/threonine protein kinase